MHLPEPQHWLSSLESTPATSRRASGKSPREQAPQSSTSQGFLWPRVPSGSSQLPDTPWGSWAHTGACLTADCGPDHLCGKALDPHLAVGLVSLLAASSSGAEGELGALISHTPFQGPVGPSQGPHSPSVQALSPPPSHSPSALLVLWVYPRLTPEHLTLSQGGPGIPQPLALLWAVLPPDPLSLPTPSSVASHGASCTSPFCSPVASAHGHMPQPAPVTFSWCHSCLCSCKAYLTALVLANIPPQSPWGKPLHPLGPLPSLPPYLVGSPSTASPAHSGLSRPRLLTVLTQIWALLPFLLTPGTLPCRTLPTPHGLTPGSPLSEARGPEGNLHFISSSEPPPHKLLTFSAPTPPTSSRQGSGQGFSSSLLVLVLSACDLVHPLLLPGP